MARRKRKSGTLKAYFRKVFSEHPEWLEQRSNSVVLDRYRADHQLSPERPVQERVLNALTNTKSELRKQQREGTGAVTALAAAEPRRAPNTHVESMEHLEEQIDECLTLAKCLDRDGLESVIHLLRRARNEVVWKMGEP